MLDDASLSNIVGINSHKLNMVISVNQWIDLGEEKYRTHNTPHTQISNTKQTDTSHTHTHTQTNTRTHTHTDNIPVKIT